MRRVVSLVPSCTDIVVALGAAESLVGVSADCDAPSSVPVITRPLLSPEAGEEDPAGVDAAVREQMASGGLLYNLDVAAVVGLAPDVVFAQDSCSVCALPSSEVAAALRARHLDCEIVSVDPTDLESVLASFATVGRALGGSLASAGQDLETSCRERLGALTEARDQSTDTRSVVVLDWLDPVFVAGNWVPELVQAAGRTPLLARPGEPSRAVSPAELESVRPDVVVVAPCGLPLPAAVSAARRSGLLRALASAGARVVAFDGRVCFSRPGPRLVDGAEALAAWLCGGRPPESAMSVEVEMEGISR